MYKKFAMAVAFVCAGLFLAFAIDGSGYVATYGIAGSDAVDFLALRVAPMFAGLAVMLWMSRDLPQGPMRAALCTGMAVVFAGIAFTGLYEFGRSYATWSISVAAIAEMIIAGLFLVAARR